MLKIKRAYEPHDKEDGFRILIDRLWPRGLTKEEVKADLWLKEIAPSSDLRKWFAHDPAKWKKFMKDYLKELEEKPDLIKIIKDKMSKGTVTLVYGAKDEEHNDAAVLKEFLKNC